MMCSGKKDKVEYAVTLNFYKDINPEVGSEFSVTERQKSQWSCTPRCVQFHLKKDTDESWPQLLKNKNEYKNLLQIDWALWADSDDEDENGNPAGNFQLPPNFQELMRQYNPDSMPMDDGCGCGCGCDYDQCGCGDDHCHCAHEGDEEEEDEDSDSGRTMRWSGR